MLEIVLRGRGPNTMSLPMLEQLERELDGAEGAPLVITGEGDAFSAGLDLDALAQADGDQLAALLSCLDRVVRKLFLHPSPTLALVNGHAVAGGCLLVQCCDLRIAADTPTLRIGKTGVAIGLCYPPFVPRVFAHRLSGAGAETVLLGAERYAPEAALRLGLLDAVAPATTLRETALAALEARVRLPRAAYADAKRSLRAPVVAGHEADRAHFEQHVLPSWTAALVRRPA